jgi:hypothetical protein
MALSLLACCARVFVARYASLSCSIAADLVRLLGRFVCSVDLFVLGGGVARALLSQQFCSEHHFGFQEFGRCFYHPVLQNIDTFLSTLAQSYYRNNLARIYDIADKYLTMVMLRKSDRTPRLLPQTRQTRQSSQQKSHQQTDGIAQENSPSQRSQRAQKRHPMSPSSQALVLYNVSATPVDNQSPSSESTALLSKEGIDGMSIEHVKSELSRAFYADKTTCSILDYLEAETDSSKRMAAAANVLNELADTSENAAVYTAFIWRYIELQQLWDPSHQNKCLHSADAFLDSLDQREFVKRNITLGRSTRETNSRYIKIITDAWGTGWYNEFKKQNLVQEPKNLSKRVLEQMAAACKSGLSILVVTKHCQGQMDSRINRPLAEGLNRTQPRQCSFIIPADFKGLMDKSSDSRRSIEGKTTKEIYFPDLPENRYKLQLDGIATVTTTAISSASDQARKGADPVAKPTRKRKLQDEADDNGKRVVSETTKWRLVKTRDGHLIREPVQAADAVAAAEESDPSQGANPQSSELQNVGTQDQSIIISGLTQRQDTISLSSQDASEPEDGDHGTDCEGYVIMSRLTNQLQWSQDGRECCKKCKDAISAAQYGIDRAMMIINSAHNVPNNGNSQSE